MSVRESLQTLQANSKNVTSIKSNGNCLLRYYSDGKKRKESFRVTVVGNPPHQIYLQGNIKFDARGIVMGANEQEFWLAVKPSEVSSYWSGQWSQVEGSEGLMISPKVVLEALGIVTLADEDDIANWSLSNEGPYDILMEQDDKGNVLKRLYVYACDYLIHKIEYLDAFGTPEVIAELDRYTEVVEGFKVPELILISRITDDQTESAKISLSNTKEFPITPQRARILFNPPDSEGFKNKRELINGQWVDR
ncbi:MAG: hypothetical protein JW837_01790 [Sedimentisphaerales bacterium]|nr:hypothetical protein [Sedimentisphaerales bacterium]